MDPIYNHCHWPFAVAYWSFIAGSLLLFFLPSTAQCHEISDLSPSLFTVLLSHHQTLHIANSTFILSFTAILLRICTIFYSYTGYVFVFFVIHYIATCGFIRYCCYQVVESHTNLAYYRRWAHCSSKIKVIPHVARFKRYARFTAHSGHQRPLSALIKLSANHSMPCHK